MVVLFLYFMFGRYHQILQPHFNEVKTALDIGNNKVKEAEKELRDGYEQMGRLSNVDVAKALVKNNDPNVIKAKANLAAALRKVVSDLEKK